MTVYNGEQITPRQANPDEQSNIEMINLKDNM